MGWAGDIGVKSEFGGAESWIGFDLGLIPKSSLLSSAGSSGIVGGIIVEGRVGEIDFLFLANSN